MAAFGDHGEVVAALVEGLRPDVSADVGVSLVAEQDGEILGHVMFSRSLLDAPRRLVDVQVLSPLAVLPAWQRKGMGAALVRRGLELMAESDVPVVFVEGPPAYYSRLGSSRLFGHLLATRCRRPTRSALARRDAGRKLTP